MDALCPMTRSAASAPMEQVVHSSPCVPVQLLRVHKNAAVAQAVPVPGSPSHSVSWELDAIAVLQRLSDQEGYSGTVAALGVSGLGKSTAQSFVATQGRGGGFEVDSRPQGTTDGIWLWPSLVDGLIVLDVAGLEKGYTEVQRFVSRIAIELW